MAADWHEEWKKDSGAAKKKYEGKVIELTGEIDSVGADPYGDIGYVYLKTPGGLGIRCGLEDKALWFKVGPDCKVKVRGKPDGPSRSRRAIPPCC